MGSGNSSAIAINLDRNIIYFIFLVKCISGIVDLNITEEKLEADEIYIKLTGEIGYTTTQLFQQVKVEQQHKLNIIMFHFILLKLFLHNLNLDKKN